MRLARKFALGLVTTSLIAIIVPAGAGAVETPAIYIDKVLAGGEPGYYTPGDTITYRYEVTANDRFINVAVTDNKCAPVDPVLGGGPGGAYNIGDTQTPFGSLNGLAGEKWIYTCSMVLPAGVTPGATFVNTGKVEAIVPTPGWDQWQGILFSDTDQYSLSGVILRKQVVLYWDYSNSVPYPAAANIAFDVDVYKGGDLKGTEVVKANDPLELWVGAGTWKLQEQTPPTPYKVVPGRGTWNDITAGSWRDNTFFNYIDFDLSIEKWGPSIRVAGQTVTYEYKVKNDGPAAVEPVVTDDKCSPVTYLAGDTNADQKIQASETWTFKCTYTPNWASVFPGYLKNTGRVVADEYPEAWTPLYGGDNDPANDTDYVKLYPFVLRKDVGLYTGGTPNWAFADSTAFTVKAYKGADYKTTFTIAEGAPKYLWLSSGTWKFTEINLPKGYKAFYPNATITFTTGNYPDWTHLNVTCSGCSHGYWKTHTADWPAGYLPTQLVGTYFPETDYYDTKTLAQALAFPGGSGVAGAEQILLRQAVASLLNEAEYGAAFGPYASVAALKTAVNIALASGNRTTMLRLATTLDYWNNSVCR
jgi:hypothetical protein